MGLLKWEFEKATLILTLTVSLEAIFLSLFILRGQNVQSERMEKNLEKDLAATKRIEDKL